jgi:hypothetical protein
LEVRRSDRPTSAHSTKNAENKASQHAVCSINSIGVPLGSIKTCAGGSEYSTDVPPQVHGDSDSFVSDLEGRQWIGEMSFFTNEVASVTIRAKIQCRLVCFPMERTRELCHSLQHSVAASAFRQLPSQFAKQMAVRTIALTKEVVAVKQGTVKKVAERFKQQFQVAVRKREPDPPDEDDWVSKVA